MPQKIAIVLGHSHIGALTSAIKRRTFEAAPPGADGLHLLLFAAWNHDGDPPYVVPDGADGDVFNPAILASAWAAAATAAPGGEASFVTLFGGNAHFVLALMRHERPFDFVLPEGPSLPLDPAAEILPSGFVTTMLQQQMDRYLYQLFQLRRAVTAPIHALVPPPPIGEDAFITDRLDAFFLLNAPRRELSPPALRLKMWVLQRRLLKDLCEAQQVRAVDPPVEARTAQGFLDPSCYGTDATHGGPRYGDLLLEQLERLFDAPLVSFAVFE